MSTIFLQQILSRKLLQSIIDGKKNNFSDRFTLKPIVA